MFLERGGDQAGVTVESQRELGQVVGANRDAVEMIKELIRKNGVGRQLRSENQTIVDVVEGGNAVENAGTVLPSGISGLVVERLQDHRGHLLHGLGRRVDHGKAVVSVHGLGLAQLEGALLQRGIA
jgi:hypothetical protein